MKIIEHVKKFIERNKIEILLYFLFLILYYIFFVYNITKLNKELINLENQKQGIRRLLEYQNYASIKYFFFSIIIVIFLIFIIMMILLQFMILYYQS